MRKYWLSGRQKWIFSTKEKTSEGKRLVELIRAAQIPIRRPAKVCKRQTQPILQG